MEVEVRRVAGAEGCFVSLPLSLIHTLQRGLDDYLPPVLGLELRSLAEDDARRWFLAWSGSASRSNSVEVPQKLAECISLPDKTKAKLRAIPELSKAHTVNIEPATVEDWEILESRPESAEDVMLTQVGVVYEGMKFPLWLYGHVIVEFLVISCSPNKSLVQLVPGTEIVVAPKTRFKPPPKPNPPIEQAKSKALLRVQAGDHKHVHQFNYRGVELGVALTSCVFIHPETALNIGFGNLEFGVVSPKFEPKEGSKIGKGEVSVTKKVLNSTRESNRHVVVQVIYSNSVGKGHLMLPQPVRHYIRADVHEWVYMKKHIFISKKGSPLLTMSPLRFKIARQNKAEENTDDDFYDRENMNTYPNNNTIPLNLIEDLIASLSKEESLIKKDKEFLIKSWLTGQIKAITLQNDGVKTFVLPSKSLLHFEVLDHKFGKKKLELIYLLAVQFEESNGGNLNENFEIGFETDMTNFENFNPDLGKLELGDPVSLETFAESKLNGGFELDVASLSWMEATIADASKRSFVLLSHFCRKLVARLGSSLPGHVLIHGPPGSGKTTLCKAVAKIMQEHHQTLAHMYTNDLISYFSYL